MPLNGTANHRSIYHINCHILRCISVFKKQAPFGNKKHIFSKNQSFKALFVL